jgi:hypothetical protein
MITLTELLAVIPMMLVVLGSTLALHNLATRELGGQENRVRSLIDQKNGLERITRELRDAIAVTYQSAQIIDAQTTNGRWVRYDCSGSACRRSEGPQEGVFDAGPVVVIDGVRSADFQLFADSDTGFQPNIDDPTYVAISLKVDVKGAKSPIALDDGFNLRNEPTEPPEPDEEEGV